MMPFAAVNVALVLSLGIASEQEFLPEGKGKEILESTCQECHGLDRVTSKALTGQRWKATVDRMVAKGATLKKADVDVLVEYLTTYFGPETPSTPASKPPAPIH